MPEEKVVWEVDFGDEISGGETYLKIKLAEGWEPFAVTRTPGGEK